MNFWDTLKSVGVSVGSTAGTVYQSSLGAFAGVANSKINQVAGAIQSQVGAITKPSASQPTQTSPMPAALPTTKQTVSFGLAGVAIAGVVIFLLTRKNA